MRAEMELSAAAEGLVRDTRQRLLLQATGFAAQGEIQWPDDRPRTEGEKIAVQFQPPERLQQIAARPLDQLVFTDLIDLWTGLAAQVQSGGILSLNNYAESTADPFLREALQLAVDGCAPDLLRDMLETRLEARLDGIKKAHRMVVEGVCAVQSGKEPEEVEEAVRAVGG